ncbi:MAG TPA: hypothetical protein VGG15_07955 [Terriglobales bacterium]
MNIGSDGVSRAFSYACELILGGDWLTGWGASVIEPPVAEAREV